MKTAAGTVGVHWLTDILVEGFIFQWKGSENFLKGSDVKQPGRIVRLTIWKKLRKADQMVIPGKSGGRCAFDIAGNHGFRRKPKNFFCKNFPKTRRTKSDI